MQTSLPAALPQHVAIIMDGNRRWAAKRGMPRALGHVSGARRVRQIVEACSARGVHYLTLFAFSTENWQRPADEVSSLMRLLVHYLQKEVSDMHASGVRLKVVGDLSRFDQRLQNLMVSAQALTAHNNKITLTIAANYGGRWDMVQACKRAISEGLRPDQVDEEWLSRHMALSFAPDPDLFIRTGGEMRVSNFMLWQSAYSEFFFTECLWPDFGEAEIDAALRAYAQRERRFGGLQPRAAVPESR